jgi:hypothetical protein
MPTLPHILLSIFLLGFTPGTHIIQIHGHLRESHGPLSGYITFINVFVKGDDKILASTQSDDKGDFILSFDRNNVTTFDFYCSGAGVDNMLIASVPKIESEMPEMTFYIPGRYNKNVLGRVICPKCKKADKVYKISYGDAPVFTRRITKSGDTTYSSIYKGTYQAFCMQGPANYYCDRDKVKF